MSSEVDPIALLRASQRLRNDQEFADYEKALALLAERMDPADLPDLHRAFDDETEDYEVYWSLVHLIEDYDFTAGARVYLDILPEMLPTAREWMKLLAIRQLNDQDARRLLIEAGRSASSANRSALDAVLTELVSEGGSPSADALATRAEQALTALRDA